MVILTPTFDDLFDLDDLINITWSGGILYGNVYIRYMTNIDTNWQYGYGIPQDPIDNTGLFVWDIDDTFPVADTVQIAVFSESLASSNYDDIEFGPIEIQPKDIPYTLIFTPQPTSSLEVQLFGSIDDSALILVNAGQPSVQTTHDYMGTIIGIGIKTNGAYQGKEVAVTYLGRSQTITSENIISVNNPNAGSFSNAIIFIVCGSIASAIIVIATVVVVIRSRQKRRNAEHEVPLLEN